MENKWEEKSTNEILIEIKQLELDYDALKSKIVSDFDKLMLLEEQYKQAHNVINNRLKFK
jgi:hypothetical protein